MKITIEDPKTFGEIFASAARSLYDSTGTLEYDIADCFNGRRDRVGLIDNTMAELESKMKAMRELYATFTTLKSELQFNDEIWGPRGVLAADPLDGLPID